MDKQLFLAALQSNCWGLAGVEKAEVQGHGENQELPLWRPGEDLSSLSKLVHGPHCKISRFWTCLRGFHHLLWGNISSEQKFSAFKAILCWKPEEYLGNSRAGDFHGCIFP